MRRTGRFIVLVVIAAAGGVALAVWWPSAGNRAVPDVTRADAMTVYGYANRDTPLWRMEAESGTIDERDQTLHDVTISFYEGDGTATRVRGDRLERTDAIGRLTGEVRMERPDGLLLTTASVTWDEADERLEAGPIVLTTSELRMSAVTFAYDLASDTASFGGGVEATADWETSWTLEASRAEEHDGVMTFYGAVTATSDADDAYVCDRLEVSTENETVLLTGNVSGEGRGGTLRAASLRWSEEGIVADGAVTARIDLEAGASDDP